MDAANGGVSAWNLEGFGTEVARFEVPARTFTIRCPGRLTPVYAQAARRYRWCKPPTCGIAITLPRSGGSISRGIGEFRSNERCARDS